MHGCSLRVQSAFCVATPNTLLIDIDLQLNYATFHPEEKGTSKMREVANAGIAIAIVLPEKPKRSLLWGRVG
jgi:hypothetical protein